MAKVVFVAKENINNKGEEFKTKYASGIIKSGYTKTVDIIISHCDYVVEMVYTHDNIEVETVYYTNDFDFVERIINEYSNNTEIDKIKIAVNNEIKVEYNKKTEAIETNNYKLNKICDGEEIEKIVIDDYSIIIYSKNFQKIVHGWNDMYYNYKEDYITIRNFVRCENGETRTTNNGSYVYNVYTKRKEKSIIITDRISNAYTYGAMMFNIYENMKNEMYFVFTIKSNYSYNEISVSNGGDCVIIYVYNDNDILVYKEIKKHNKLDTALHEMIIQYL